MAAASALLAEPALHVAAWLALLATFALALPGKLRDLEAFAATVRNYRLLPSWASTPVALAVIVGEILVALGLLWPATRAAAAVLAAFMLALFALAVALNLARGRRSIDCGCFRSLVRERLSWGHVARNGLLVAAAALVATVEPRPAQMLDLALGAAAAISFVLLSLAAAQLSFDPRHELVLEQPQPASGSVS